MCLHGMTRGGSHNRVRIIKDDIQNKIKANECRSFFEIFTHWISIQYAESGSRV